MTTKKEKQKQIIVEQVYVHGYLVHTNGKKSPFVFDKSVFDPKDLEGIFNGVGRIYK